MALADASTNLGMGPGGRHEAGWGWGKPPMQRELTEDFVLGHFAAVLLHLPWAPGCPTSGTADADDTTELKAGLFEEITELEGWRL